MIARMILGDRDNDGLWNLHNSCTLLIMLSIPGFICAGLWSLFGVYIPSILYNFVLAENWLAESFCCGFALGIGLAIAFILVLMNPGEC